MPSAEITGLSSDSNFIIALGVTSAANTEAEKRLAQSNVRDAVVGNDFKVFLVLIILLTGSAGVIRLK
ncbi:hypothetical protein TUM3794_18350 [Shewanella colwelliana]|uniref:Uncharacterized protein n=1 Tax=Shewanella colwelliana TaxID=23 RepID=A0ABQ4P083_SHECO|nr:hypothetical protein TUM3794_18350 [Shewanella colwelliana]